MTGVKRNGPIMKAYYRLSDRGNGPKGADWTTCLKSFLNAFANSEVVVIADNCTAETLNLLEELKLAWKFVVFKKTLGNANSLWWAIQVAANEAKNDEPVYFCEDDYIHASCAGELFVEGLEVGHYVGHYVTLYDHPWKYTRRASSPALCGGLYRTKTSHWIRAISTCCTFGTTGRQLRQDLEVWGKHLNGVGVVVPPDHLIWCDLMRYGRFLAQSIPGAAVHLDDTFDPAGRDQWAMHY